jgi:hypothetical protein
MHYFTFSFISSDVNQIADLISYLGIRVLVPIVWCTLVIVVLIKYFRDGEKLESSSISAESLTKWKWESNSRLAILVVFTGVFGYFIVYLDRSITKPRLPVLQAQIMILEDSVKRLKQDHQILGSLIQGTPIRIECRIPKLVNRQTLGSAEILLYLTRSEAPIKPLLVQTSGQLKGDGIPTSTYFNLYLNGSYYLDSIAQIEIVIKKNNVADTRWYSEDTIAIKRFLVVRPRPRAHRIKKTQTGLFTVLLKKDVNKIFD